MKSLCSTINLISPFIFLFVRSVISEGQSAGSKIRVGHDTQSPVTIGVGCQSDQDQRHPIRRGEHTEKPGGVSKQRPPLRQLQV